MATRKIEQVMSMIKRLTVGELVELRRRLESDPILPPAGAPVGAKPKGPAPHLSAAATKKAER